MAWLILFIVVAVAVGLGAIDTYLSYKKQEEEEYYAWRIRNNL